MESHRLFLGSKVSREGWAWLMVLASLPLVAWCLTRLSSGFDYWPAMALARGVRYGATVLFAYPLPLYLPFAPLGLLPDPWPQLLAPVISIAFLAAGLWLWGARRIVVLAALLLSPVGLGVLVNSNFNSGLAVFGLGLAVWAKRTGHHPLVGLGIALSLWRPANCLPAIAVLMLSGWRWRGLIEAAVAGLLFLAPITAVAFLYQPDWLVFAAAACLSRLGRPWSPSFERRGSLCLRGRAGRRGSGRRVAASPAHTRRGHSLFLRPDCAACDARGRLQRCRGASRADPRGE